MEVQNFFLRLKKISQGLCSAILWFLLLKLKKLSKQTQSIHIIILGYFARVVLKLYLLYKYFNMTVKLFARESYAASVRVYITLLTRNDQYFLFK